MTHKSLTGLLLLALVFSGLGVACAEEAEGAAETPAAQTATLDDDTQKTLYAMGMLISERFKLLDLSPEEIKQVQAGFSDGLMGNEPSSDVSAYGPKIQGFLQARTEQAAARESAASEAYLADAATQEGVVKTTSGALYMEQQSGSGPSPAVSDRVRIHYHGTLRDGTVFDSSVERDRPAEFALSGVIPCFSEGLQQMKVGGKARLVCPASTAYGDGGSPPLIKPGATINFEVELLEILAAPAAATP